jgi:D-inositol-3-phosphate glycosyltransferase
LEGKETGGMNVYVLELSRALARLGHNVDIFTRSHEQNDPLIIQEEESLRVFHIPAGPRESLSKKVIQKYLGEFSSNIRAYLSSCDVVHAHYYLSGLATGDIPFVMSFHTLALMKNLVARDTLERESQFRIRSEFSLMKRAGSIIASSEIDKEYMQYLYDGEADKIHVVHPGIDTSLFHPIDKTLARTHIGASDEHKIVLFVGRIEPLKGIDTLMYAMKILKKKNPDQTVCLWIVGGDTTESVSHWPKTLRELASIRRELGISEENVHFVGRKPQSDLPYYYNAADVVVMPSHYESFGMSALEAMGCAVPVITTNVAGISAHVSHVISANNPLLLADQISHVLNDHSNSPKPFNTFTWEVSAQKMLTVYSSRILKAGS